MKTTAKPLVTTELGERENRLFIRYRGYLFSVKYKSWKIKNLKIKKNFQETINVVGATGKELKQTFFNPINFKFNKGWIIFICALMSSSCVRKRPDK